MSVTCVKRLDGNPLYVLTRFLCGGVDEMDSSLVSGALLIPFPSPVCRLASPFRRANLNHSPFERVRRALPAAISMQQLRAAEVMSSVMILMRFRSCSRTDVGVRAGWRGSRI